MGGKKVEMKREKVAANLPMTNPVKHAKILVSKVGPGPKALF